MGTQLLPHTLFKTPDLNTSSFVCCQLPLCVLDWQTHSLIPMRRQRKRELKYTEWTLKPCLPIEGHSRCSAASIAALSSSSSFSLLFPPLSLHLKVCCCKAACLVSHCFPVFSHAACPSFCLYSLTIPRLLFIFPPACFSFCLTFLTFSPFLPVLASSLLLFYIFFHPWVILVAGLIFSLKIELTADSHHNKTLTETMITSHWITLFNLLSHSLLQSSHRMQVVSVACIYTQQTMFSVQSRMIQGQSNLSKWLSNVSFILYDFYNLIRSMKATFIRLETSR